MDGGSRAALRGTGDETLGEWKGQRGQQGPLTGRPPVPGPVEESENLKGMELVRGIPGMTSLRKQGVDIQSDECLNCTGGEPGNPTAIRELGKCDVLKGEPGCCAV